MRILAIETSCDETGISIIEADGSFGPDFSYSLLGNSLLSQVETHAPYGGVFPNLARREHEKNLVPLFAQALEEAKLSASGTTPLDGLDDILTREQELLPQLKEFLASHAKPDIDCIAVTHGPGLEPALWVGVNFARALAHAWQLPLVPVNHMEGHIILSAMAEGRFAPFKFPLLSLLVSGGHTELVLSREPMRYELVGQTRDDAVGEAFDKVARLMDLPYPGGPEIAKLAEMAREKQLPSTVQLPRPMMDSKDYDFSFSGIKTAVRRVVEAHQPLSDSLKMEIAREFEDAVTDVLVAKTIRAVEEHGAHAVLIGGGVSANQYLRERMQEGIKEYGLDAKLLIPPRALSTDNALMIALAGYFRAQAGQFADISTLRANGNLRLSGNA
ncbi:tRNA (adenosine(37)-N6)-threonylcarbamoyltransferase complex transferase subunit TsaD [bacterium]|nr:tRNA (adenosine(37)-N6)-threonylcarbamoyltransferase complex transferase subunit TsaD [bacterium]